MSNGIEPGRYYYNDSYEDFTSHNFEYNMKKNNYGKWE